MSASSSSSCHHRPVFGWPVGDHLGRSLGPVGGGQRFAEQQPGARPRRRPARPSRLPGRRRLGRNPRRPGASDASAAGPSPRWFQTAAATPRCSPGRHREPAPGRARPACSTTSSSARRQSGRGQVLAGDPQPGERRRRALLADREGQRGARADGGSGRSRWPGPGAGRAPRSQQQQVDRLRSARSPRSAPRPSRRRTGRPACRKPAAPAVRPDQVGQVAGQVLGTVQVAGRPVEAPPFDPGQPQPGPAPGQCEPAVANTSATSGGGARR